MVKGLHQQKSKYNQRTISASMLQHPEKYCGKNRERIDIRSSYEISFVKYLDRSENIISWSSEEICVVYKSPVDNRNHRYFPDVYMKYINPKGKVKEALVEIKPFHEAQDKPYLTEGMSEKTKYYTVKTWTTNQAKWKYAREYCRKRGWSFQVITERDLVFGK